MSLQSAVQHAAMAAGGIVSSRLLETAPDGKLLGIEKIAGFSSVLVVVAVLLIVSLARQVRYREN
jgi:predicted MFS family arabinose efflux permease